jgi:hypothetical protein
MRPRADERARERLGGAEHGDGGDGGSGLVGNVGLGKEAPPVDDYAEWLVRMFPRHAIAGGSARTFSDIQRRR